MLEYIILVYVVIIHIMGLCFLMMMKKIEIGSNDFGFTDDTQIKVNDREYLVSAVITKV